jgi:hypothetical protein
MERSQFICTPEWSCRRIDPDLQGKFLNQLSELGVTKDMLYGQQAGKIFNQGLRSAAYTPGSNLQEVASVTAEALKNLNP